MAPIEYLEKTKDLPHSSLLEEAVSYLKNKTTALELGSGAGRDTKFLLTQGFKITAIDKDPTVSDFLKELPYQENLTFLASAFNDFQFGKYDLVTSFNSLSFHPKTLPFSRVFEKIKSALNPGGIFVGNLFGDKDFWNTGEDMRTFVAREEAEDFLKGLEIIKFEELEKDSPSALGSVKHWHIFNIIAREHV